MVRTTHTYRKWQLWLMGAMAAFAACTAQAQSTNQSKPVQTIAEAFEITWSRQPEARSQIERQQALRAQQAAAQAWTPEPPSLELSSKSDSWRKQAGATEQTLGISMPLCSITCNKPTVLSVILFPPAFGPEITIICCLLFSSKVCGIVFNCFSLFFSNKIG